jgi:glycylpeptide N-tetradecanoyltransferase
VKTIDEIKKDPYALPASFEWTNIDVDDDNIVSLSHITLWIIILHLSQLKQVYTLLNENYVEDDDNMFRFDYSVDFLRW